MSGSVYLPGPRERTVLAMDGSVLVVPRNWGLLLPGDATVTRRVKAAGDHWVVQEKKGRRTFSRGVWADAEVVAKIQSDVAAERSTEVYAKRRQSELRRREETQASYEGEFLEAVVQFLAFHEAHQALAMQLAKAVTSHAIPVGSGTVARTKRIPIQQRAEAAVIAWMRHQTTAYDQMKIARIKGRRREVRRELAKRSNGLLERYRQGDAADPACPLMIALAQQTHS